MMLPQQGTVKLRCINDRNYTFLTRKKKTFKVMLTNWKLHFMKALTFLTLWKIAASSTIKCLHTFIYISFLYAILYSQCYLLQFFVLIFQKHIEVNECSD